MNRSTRLFGGVIDFLFTFLIISFLVTVWAGFDTCDSIVNSNDTSKSPILCMGKLTKTRTTYLVTTDLWVYELHDDLFDVTDKLWFINKTVTPKPMLHFWNNLIASDYSKSIKDGCFTAQDSVSTYLLKIGYSQKFEVNSVGFIYDIVASIVNPGVNNSFPILPISSIDFKEFYAIVSQSDSLGIIQFSFDGSNIPYSKALIQKTEMYKMCLVEDIQISITKEPNLCDQPEWSLVSGYSDTDNFYLFAKDFMVIFPTEAFKDNTEAFPFVKQTLADFIICSNKSEYEDARLKEKSLERRANLISIVVIVILVVFIGSCTLFLWCTIFDKDDDEMPNLKAHVSSQKGKSVGVKTIDSKH